jgi:hypothetical protein
MEKTDVKIATTILIQKGRGALYMLGARDYYAMDNGVVFKIGRNSKRVNRIKITLNSMDTYDIEFWYMSMKKDWTAANKLIASDKSVYCDGLGASIERNTGLYTSLGGAY